MPHLREGNRRSGVALKGKGANITRLNKFTKLQERNEHLGQDTAYIHTLIYGVCQSLLSNDPSPDPPSDASVCSCSVVDEISLQFIPVLVILPKLTKTRSFCVVR